MLFGGCLAPLGGAATDVERERDRELVPPRAEKSPDAEHPACGWSGLRARRADRLCGRRPTGGADGPP